MKVYGVFHDPTIKDGQDVFLPGTAQVLCRAAHELQGKEISMAFCADMYPNAGNESPEIQTVNYLIGHKPIGVIADARLNARNKGTGYDLPYSVTHTPEGGESWMKVTSRVSSFLNDELQQGHEAILCSTGRGVGRVLRHILGGMPLEDSILRPLEDAGTLHEWECIEPSPLER